MAAETARRNAKHLLHAARHATTPLVTTNSGDSDFSRDWDAVRGDGDIQFAPVEIPVAEVDVDDGPSWLDRFFEWLADLFSPIAEGMVASWDVIFWVLVVAGAALILFAIYRIIDPEKFQRRKREIKEREWTPEEGAARQLLEEADRLAQEGRYDEATHLLLQRSVGQIAEIRPDLIDPSSTAREIAALPALPDAARTAFATIADRVERSLFALRKLSAEDWQAARGAYSEFALGYKGAQA